MLTLPCCMVSVRVFTAQRGFTGRRGECDFPERFSGSDFSFSVPAVLLFSHSRGKNAADIYAFLCLYLNELVEPYGSGTLR